MNAVKMEVQVWYIVYLRQEDMRAQVAKNVNKKKKKTWFRPKMSMRCMHK